MVPWPGNGGLGLGRVLAIDYPQFIVTCYSNVHFRVCVLKERERERSFFHLLSVLVTFSTVLTKLPNKSKLRENRFILAHSLRVQLIMGSPGSRNLRQLLTLHLQSGSQDLCSVTFLLSMQPRTQAQRMVLPSFRVKLPTSINLIEIIPHRHARG